MKKHEMMLAMLLIGLMSAGCTQQVAKEQSMQIEAEKQEAISEQKEVKEMQKVEEVVEKA